MVVDATVRTGLGLGGRCGVQPKSRQRGARSTSRGLMRASRRRDGRRIHERGPTMGGGGKVRLRGRHFDMIGRCHRRRRPYALRDVGSRGHRWVGWSRSCGITLVRTISSDDPRNLDDATSRRAGGYGGVRLRSHRR
ncbi:hypothetical protein C2E23DRAFT_804798 [Lenzites betulinus]|nr:hypothetical protein C2E23DRAFT_804798 [Lenzites betulinus]